MTRSRREIIHSAAACAGMVVAPALGATPAFAFAPQTTKQVAGYYRYRVGDFELTAVTDGSVTFPLTDSFVKNASRDAVNQALEEAYLPKDQMTIVFTPLVVNTGSKLVVIDTGYGPAAMEKSKGASGQFHTNLAAAGFDRNAVDVVLISHFHPDHINGLLTADGKPAFGAVEVFAPETEWNFWMDDSNMNRAPEAAKGGFGNVRRVFSLLGKKPTLYDDTRDVIAGVKPISTPGHTPGHMSFAVESGKQSLLVTCDLTNRPELFLRHPEWHAMFDMDPTMAEESRRRMFDRAAADKTLVQGFHFPFPALGHVEKNAGGYRLVLSPWSATL